MRIEPEAKEIIMNVLEGREADSIVIDIVNEGGSDTIALGIGLSAEADFVTEIDGVKVIAAPETLEILERVIFIAQEGRLAVVEPCGCGCGCGGHEDGEGCGCEGHDHEGGCGCEGHDHEHSHEGGCGCEGHDHEHSHEGGCGCGCGHNHG